MPTYADGIGSSSALDTSGEIVDLKGLDISSLVGAPANWEHESKLPSQIIGKIIAAHKIFSEEDCLNERHKHYWNKIKLPFLYCAIRLFDDKENQKPSAVEAAALFKDDAAHPNEQPMIGFSIEGAKLSKSGAIITHSIARKLTVTCMPANKTCIAEMMPPSKKEKSDPNDISELFKCEMELFKFEPTYIELLEKKEKLAKYNNMEQGGAADKGYSSAGAGAGAGGGAGGGAFIGSQLAMSEDLEKSLPDGWSGKILGNEGSFSHSKHGNVNVSKMPVGNFEVRHNGKLIGVSPSVSHAGEHAKKYISNLAKSEELKKGAPFATPEAAKLGQLAFGAPNAAPKPAATAPAPKAPAPSMASSGMFSPAFVQGAKSGGGFVKKEKKGESLKKALSAGSSNAAPGQLTGGAALAPESLNSRTQKVHSMKKKEKSKWYSRAEEAYNAWDKKGHFKEYMQSRMPHLASGEVDAIGRILALKKNLQAEKKLSKMYASYFGKSEIEKGSDGMMAAEEYIHGLPKSHPALGQHKGHTYRRIRPPTKESNHWTWAINHPTGENSEFNAPAESAGSRDAVHAHIDSLAHKNNKE